MPSRQIVGSRDGLSRRAFLVRVVGAGLAASAVAGLAAACSSPSQSAPTPVPTGAAKPAATSAPAQAGATQASKPAAAAPTRTLTIALASDINTLDPHQTASVGTDLSVISHLYSSLITRGPDLKLQPQVADSWQATSDTTWRFKLHPGITFSDGEKLDATAVKWNVDRVLNPDTKARVKSWFDLVSEAKVVDDATVDVTTKSPYPAFADQLSMFYLLPPKWATDNNPAAKALGTGPYTLREWVKDDHVTLDVNPNYWGPAPPFKTVTFRAIPEASSRVSGLLAGDLDIITGEAPSDFDRIKGAGLIAGSTASARSAFVKFNTLLKPLDDARVRQALNYAVDKDSLIKNIFNGTTQKSNGEVLTGAYFGYNPDLQPYDFDVAKAKQLLSDAGQASGFAAELDVPTGTYLLGSETSQAIAGQLAPLGVQVKVTEMPFSVYMDKYLPQKNLAPMAYITQAWPTLDADGLLSLFEAGNQYAYWNDQQFSDLLKQARSTTNQQQRADLYKQATARMRDQAPVLFLFPQPATYGTGKSVDWKARPDDWVRAWDVQPK